MKAMIPALVIEKMEGSAFGIASKDYSKFPNHNSGVHMSSLFDMTAGTSSGSMVAAGVSAAHATTGIPLYWGTNIVDDMFVKYG
jgi:patatin-like phospholipase/acyl hydrolase